MPGLRHMSLSDSRARTAAVTNGFGTLGTEQGGGDGGAGHYSSPARAHGTSSGVHAKDPGRMLGLHSEAGVPETRACRTVEEVLVRTGGGPRVACLVRSQGGDLSVLLAWAQLTAPHGQTRSNCTVPPAPATILGCSSDLFLLQGGAAPLFLCSRAQ